MIEKIKLIPYCDIKPWGGNYLSNFFDCPNKTGEAWIVSTIHKKESKLENGQLLSEYINENKEKLGLNKDDEFPILIKIIDAAEDLSIQVHPDDFCAKALGYDKGKFECWKILDKTKATDIIFGIKNIDEKTLKDKIKHNELSDILIYKKIKHGDFLKVVPGTVHAILKNTLILEVQEPSDITFRLFDYNRLPKRELHIDESIMAIYNKNSNIDDDKFQIIENDDLFLIKIKGYEKFFFEIDKKDFTTFLCIKKGA